MKRCSAFFLSVVFVLFVLLGCAGGPGGTNGPNNPGNIGDDGLGTGGNPVGGIAGGPDPATRPTPGFTEVEMQPATSTTLPAPAAFLKNLSLNLSPLISVEEVRLFVKNLDFDDALSPGIEAPGPFVVRLVQGSDIVDEALPPFGTVAVPQGLYDQLDLQLQKLTVAEIPPEADDDPLVTGSLVGHSILVDGTLEITPFLSLPLLSLVHFRFVSQETPILRIETPTALNFGPDPAHLFVAFKIKTWLDVSLPGLIRTALETLDPTTLLSVLNGVLIISSDSPIPQIQGLALQIEANINASLRFAPSPDGLFDESDVQEDSFSLVVP